MDKINSVSEYNEYWRLPDGRPYVNVLEGSQITRPIPNCRKNIDQEVCACYGNKIPQFVLPYKNKKNEYDKILPNTF